MTDVEFSRLLSDLGETAKKLNQASDSVNDIIKRFQETLRSMNVGLEVWPAELKRHTWMDTNDDEEEYERGTMTQELGFTRLHDAWVLATRSAYYEKQYSYDADSDKWVEVAESPENFVATLGALVRTEGATPLLEQSRATRIAALEFFPEIVRALKDAAGEAVKAIEAARAYVISPAGDTASPSLDEISSQLRTGRARK
jgi:hypothetical protein